MRINNYISSTGYCSRREADKLVEEGKVQINDQIAQMGQQVSETDIVKVNGNIIRNKQKTVYLALNKPRGITSTTERHIKGNIIDFINYPQRIFPIGRLDKDSEGLILLTNDGQIVNQILAAENNHEKDYIVVVDNPVKKEFLQQLSKGVEIFNPVKKEMVITNPCIVKQINSHTFKITLTQGYNRQIRRMCSKLGYQVRALKRIRIINIHLDKLPVGQYRKLTDLEINDLLTIVRPE